ncbi:aliphatic sulfonate ABC transporter substrate-binding protein [Virgifigura deserti]|uniref:aliphatic sulfonate ABC transporter substrate-binding protein n=1 Tax=Virgifigura deserti TaxID=2268457 RepID=UPI003CCC1EDF
MTLGSLRKLGFSVTFAAVVALLAPGMDAAAEQPETIRIDYAYYNPVSLVLKDQGWLEEEFAADGIEIEWVLSLGSNKALELLNSSSVDFGSTAGAAALLGKIYGNPIKAVYVYSRPEWTALVTRADTGIGTVKDLKGKRVAVTRGTDPYIFLLRALDRFGLTERDIESVLLQHPDGKTALMNGDVDAWAGLDPHMAQAELNGGARLFFRDASLNTYGVLNVREEFAEEHPELVERVLAVYEYARKWSIEHPAELKQALVAAAKISDDVAEKQLTERTDLSNPVPGAAHRESIAAAGVVLQASGIIDEDESIAARVDELLDPRYIENVLEAQAALQ